MDKSIAVLGAGSFGTALAIQFARTGHQTYLWGRNSDALERYRQARCNTDYLPDAAFPDELHIEQDLETALAGGAIILMVVPSHGLRTLSRTIAPLLKPHHGVAWASKGFELGSGQLPHEVVEEEIGSHWSSAVLSGPTFAKEVGRGLPTAMTVASRDQAFAKTLATNLSDRAFRVYTSPDIIGVEVGGAVKNALAIGAGISDGLGFGANTRVALITRGLVEMTRLGKALGAEPETFMGLAGIGDLILTCTDNQSRNRRMGLALASGKTQEQAAKEIQQVVEGVHAAKAVFELSQQKHVDMPITEQVYRVLYENKAVHQAVEDLMSRALKPELN